MLSTQETTERSPIHDFGVYDIPDIEAYININWQIYKDTYEIVEFVITLTS